MENAKLRNELNKMIMEREEETRLVGIKRAAMGKELDASTTTMQEEIYTLKKKNSELLQVVATHNDKLLAAKEAHNSIREEAAAAAEDAFREQLKAVERQREKQMDNLKEQSQYFLQKRTKELQDMAAHHERFRAEAEEKYADLTAQSNYVADYVESLTMIIEKIETGQYSMREKSGIKCFVIPGRDKPAPLDLDRGRLFRSRLANAERYLKVLQGKGLRRASLNESLAASAAAEAALAAARNLGGEYADDEPSVSAKERTELRLQRDSLQTQLHAKVKEMEQLKIAHRSEVECQLVEELASHPTVEYIKTLEEDVRRYQKALQDERKKSVEMRTALDSYRRQTSINYTQTPSHMRRTVSAGSSRGTATLAPIAKPKSSMYSPMAGSSKIVEHF